MLYFVCHILSVYRCLVDMRQRIGPIMNNVYACCQITIVLVNFTCYILVWGKLRKVPVIAGLSGNAKIKRNKYQRTWKVMMLFVIAYFGQFWPFILYAGWSMFGTPSPVVVIFVVIFCNMGGVFNFLSYTLIRKRCQNVDNHETNGKSLVNSTNGHTLNH